MLQLAIASKRVELLKEIAPAVTRIAVLASPDHPGVGSELRATHEAAEKLGLVIDVFEPGSDEALLSVLDAIGRSRAEALLTLPEARTLAHRESIARSARHLRAPSIFGWKVYVEAGGLVSYGPVQARVFERLAYFVDRIIKGAKPGELPVEQPTRLELVLNAKVANDIGLLIPPALLTRADEVIE
jgi:putative ABC transport system substrate-binding protein